MNFSAANSAFQTAARDVVVSWPGMRQRITVSQPPTPADMEAVVARLEELIRLPRGWDGYSAVPVGLPMANFAFRVVQSLRSPLVAPHLVPGQRGDLQIEYHYLDWSIELHLRATNVISAWRIGPGLGEDGEELELSSDVLAVQEWLDELEDDPVAAHAAG